MNIAAKPADRIVGFWLINQKNTQQDNNYYQKYLRKVKGYP